MNLEVNKNSDIYKYKLGLGLDRINLIKGGTVTESINKGSSDLKNECGDVYSTSNKATIERGDDLSKNENLPYIRDHSKTLISKYYGGQSRNHKMKIIQSKQHLVYSILRFKNKKTSPKSGRRMAQSRVESNRRLPLTSFDHIDDEIINSGILNIQSNQ